MSQAVKPCSNLLLRRQVLGLIAGCALPPHAFAGTPLRIAAIDWAMLETAVALDVMPVAATELLQFRRQAVEPAIPVSVADLGLRGSPNLELLHLLKPDLILSSPFYARQAPALNAIAPVLSLPFYVKGEPPYDKAKAAVSELGRILERRREADALLQAQEDILAEAKSELAPFAVRPTYLVNIGDARHFRAFGTDSMFGDILTRLELPNAWADRSRYSFMAPVPIEELSARPDARIVIISDIPVEARRSLGDSMIWKSLEPVQQNRVVMVGNIDPYGGILAGLRFVRLLKEALMAGGSGN